MNTSLERVLEQLSTDAAPTGAVTKGVGLGTVIQMPLEFQVLSLEAEVRRLREAEMILLKANENLQQLAIAFSDKNRYYATLALGHYASDLEAFLHYAEHGAEDFRRTHPRG